MKISFTSSPGRNGLLLFTVLALSTQAGFAQSVGIGTTTPNRPLTIRSSSGGDVLQLRDETDTNLWHLSVSGSGLNFAETAVASYRLFLAAGGRVGIGTNTPSALLDVNGSVRFRGLSTPGLVVTDASGNLSSQGAGAGNGLFWGLGGNSGTSPASSFLGTTDAQDLVFRTNNTERLRLAQNGALYQTIANNNTLFGLNAGSGMNSAAASNVYLGLGAGQSNAAGSDNVAVGLNSAISSTTTASAMVGTLAGAGSAGTANSYFGGAAGYLAGGSFNVGLGYLAGAGMSGNTNIVIGYNSALTGGSFAGGENVVVGSGAAPATSGAQNTFLGTVSALTNAGGGQNTFLGYRTGNDNSTGSGNTFVGNLAGRYTTTGSNNTLIGNQADVMTGNGAITNATAIGYRAHVTQSNSLVLGGTGANAVKVGIGTTSPDEALEVVGNVRIPAANNYTYATARTQYLTLPAAAFTPAYEGYTAGSGSTGNGRWIFNGISGRQGYLYAPVSLPDGAVIRNVVLYVFDNDAGLDVSGHLFRTDLPGTVTTTLASLPATSGSPGSASLTLAAPISSATNNSQYTYHLRFNTFQNTNTLMIIGARIEYTVTKVE